MFSLDDLAIYPFEQFLEHFSMAFGISFSFFGGGTGCISLEKRFENTPFS
jgi:hypothetical protein